MLEWINEGDALPPIAERILLAHPRQSGEFWDIETARLLISYDGVIPVPVKAGGDWPVTYWWAKEIGKGASILITGNSWWARLDKIALPPGAEHAYGPAGLGGGHYVRQIGNVFVPQGARP